MIPDALKEFEAAIVHDRTRIRSRVGLKRANLFDPRMSAAERTAVIECLARDVAVRSQLPGGVSVADAVDAVIDDRDAVMNGHVCLHVLPEEPDPDWWISVTAQNCLADLRVRITTERGSALPATALAKASAISRIAGPTCTPDCVASFPGDPPVWRYHGLGIGSVLYTKAMTELDRITGADCRCTDHSSNEYVRTTRWKLHCRDPYKWQSNRCRICPDTGIEWEQANRTDFDDVHHDRLRDTPDLSD
ncbi:hypothetical protein [Mycobacterium talmoniae]|uniref:hypothetical protein n=1 Tax=Mycobacterium talmoniae TaxID=1858794 RepID=UPI001058853C|nr:hypothetical protein [Mycobacterium talmoniae]